MATACSDGCGLQVHLYLRMHMLLTAATMLGIYEGTSSFKNTEEQVYEYLSSVADDDI